MKIGKRICQVMLIIAILLSGCNSSRENDIAVKSEVETVKSVSNETQLSENTINKKMEIPKTLNMSIGNVKFECEVEAQPEELEKRITENTAKQQYTDIEKALMQFVGNKEFQENVEEQTMDENGKLLDSRAVTTVDGDSFYAMGSTFMFSTEYFHDIYRSFHVTVNGGKYSQSREFEFASPDDAAKQVVQALENIGFTIGNYQYTYFALDYETMREQENQVYVQASEDVKEQQYKEQWTEADNCYYIYIVQENQNMPVYFGTNFSKKDSYENMPIQALVSARGIERVDVGVLSGLYEFQPKEKEILPGDFEQMLKTVVAKYENILSESAYKVTKIKLYEMPIQEKDGSFTMRPAWLFQIMEESTMNESITLLDTETGKELNP